MTNASLARKLARLSGAQRPPSGLALNGRLGAFREMAADDFNPRDLLAEEQDRRREMLAESLLLLFAESADPYRFTDTHSTTRLEGRDYDTETPTVTTLEWAEKLAHAALSAATVLYPEVPAQTEAEE